MKSVKVELTFTEMVLGSTSGDPEITRNYIASKAEDAKKIEEEVAAIGVDGVEEKAMTVFPKLEDGTPFLWDYQVRGFFKSACDALNMINPGTKLPAYKKKIDKLVFVRERKIPYILPEGGEMGKLQRPLRGMTAQGERIALASSETVPAESKVTFTIDILQDDLEKRVYDWLDYGRYNGLGQWRNGSYGRFTWRQVK